MEYDQDEDSKMHFRFSVNRDNGDACAEYAAQESVSASYAYLGGTRWDVILKDFARFLGMVYGYDISDRVKIKPFSKLRNSVKEKDKQMSFMWGDPKDMEDTE